MQIFFPWSSFYRGRNIANCRGINTTCQKTRHNEHHTVLSHLLVCLEDVLCSNRADSRAQRLDHSICHLSTHSGGIGVENTEVALVTLHHQLQWAPLGVHAADVQCSLLTPPASTCRHRKRGANSMRQVVDILSSITQSWGLKSKTWALHCVRLYYKLTV